jgi:hypothetical protein
MSDKPEKKGAKDTTATSFVASSYFLMHVSGELFRKKFPRVPLKN